MNGAISKEPQMKHIDPHVHFRDWSESQKTTIRAGMELARSQNIVAVGDMANTKLSPKDAVGLFWAIESSGIVLKEKTKLAVMKHLESGGDGSIINNDLVELRLKTAEAHCSLKGYYLHIGATRDEMQLREAMKIAEANPRVMAIKNVYGETTGGISMAYERDQETYFRMAGKDRYNGVTVMHLEKKVLERPELWIPSNPSTWNLAKPPEMEVEALKDVIRLAGRYGYVGHIHVAHTSVPESVQIVNDAKRFMSISCGVTPHHVTLSTNDMLTTEGMKYKVNPPIRSATMMLEMRSLLRDGSIDCIETDYAPHERDRKIYDPQKPKNHYMSGIRSMDGYSAFVRDLIEIYGFSRDRIEELTYTNVKHIFTKIVE